MTRGNGRPTVAWIDLQALGANFAGLRARLAPGVSIMAVVKADAYGHGASLVAPALAAAGADVFGVATVEEAVELRGCAITQPILVLTGATRGDAATLVRHRLAAAVVDADMARDLAAGVESEAVAVHLKLDTGMTRLGVGADGLDEVLKVLKSAPGLRLEGVFSHFADAGSVDGARAAGQLRAFDAMLERIRSAAFAPRWVHIANSVACLTRPDTHRNLVRPGIVLYGSRPAGAPPEPLWRPVMHLRTRIWQLKSVPAGSAVSYGQTFVARRPSRIAVLPIGYADGYARALSNRASVLVCGQRAPVVGRVCMDLTLVDVTDVPGAAVHDEVVLWGTQGSERITVEEVAAWQDSISYEVLTRVGKRVPRVAG